MFKNAQTILCTILVLFAFSVSGQKLVKKAEIQVENGEYNLAVTSYKNYLADNPKDYATVIKLAQVYAAMGSLTDALKCYESIPQTAGLEPVRYKMQGEVLKKLGRYEEAAAIFEKYKMYSPADGDHYLASCRFAMQSMSGKPEYETFVMPSNSSASDFGLTFYKDMPVFSSFRNDILMTPAEKELNASQNSLKSFLYNSKKSRLGFIKGLDGNINNIGPISFSSNGLSCAIIMAKTQDNYNFVLSGKVSGLHIATVNERGEITSSKPFQYNEVGSSINSAHMAFDGTAIYFSSNRKSGFGGYDIYVSYLKNGSWTLPHNLGAGINTEGNEITPFLKGSELYFASDYHPGLGGFDILKSEVVNGVWTTPQNPGYGVNSMNDDYFPCVNSHGELYVTSNRLGGKGENDIYKTLKLQPVKKPVEEYTNIPKAVSLDALASETQKHTVNSNSATTVSYKENVKLAAPKEVISSKSVAFTLPKFDSKMVGTNAFADMSLKGARRIALDETIPNTEVFFIQLASVSSIKPNFNRFKSLIRYGNIYKMNNNKTIKVRLGYFNDRKEAEEILNKVKANGYKDAFITFEILNTAQMELILSSTDDNSFTDEGNFNSKKPTEEMKSYKTGSKYKVRLASYEDPIWFDVNKVKDLGRIEQWTKGGWTIFILAGYSNIEEAKKANIQAINRGFKSAEVVIDNGGILERLKQN